MPEHAAETAAVQGLWAVSYSTHQTKSGRPRKNGGTYTSNSWISAEVLKHGS